MQPLRERVLRVQREVTDTWGPAGLALAAIEGLAYDGEPTIPVGHTCADTRGRSLQGSDLALFWWQAALVGSAVRYFLAPESEATEEEILKAAEGLGHALDANALCTVAERLGLFV